MLKTDLDRRPITAQTLGLPVLALLAITLPIAMLHASAQTGPATLSGVVYDSGGAVLPDTALTLADAQQRQWHTTTDATGRFEFAAIDPGRYVLLQVSIRFPSAAARVHT